MSAQHAPRFQVVCYIAQEDGEIVGDVLEIETGCSLEHKVSGTWNGGWGLGVCSMCAGYTERGGH